jgi:hypothetical protein
MTIQWAKKWANPQLETSEEYGTSDNSLPLAGRQPSDGSTGSCEIRGFENADCSGRDLGYAKDVRSATFRLSVETYVH